MIRAVKTRRWRSIALAAMLAQLMSFASAPSLAAHLEIQGPSDAGAFFGYHVTALPNGNIVVAGPGANGGAGAIYLYSPSGRLISTLRGRVPGDSVGEAPIVVLPSGNFLVVSIFWNNGANKAAGAVTWVDGNIGLDGELSEANSLVGASTFDEVGQYVTVLGNGNYVVSSPIWSDGSTAMVGAVTWARGDRGVSGFVSAQNSLIGTHASDYVGDVARLQNGNYLVLSPLWDNGTHADVGAVTWVDGASGITGPVSEQNSLVGSADFDQIGENGAAVDGAAFANGDAVVLSPHWDNDGVVDVGAATWIDGAHGLVGQVSPLNSLVGSLSGDMVGDVYFAEGVVSLDSNRYAVISDDWSDGSAPRTGAITWCDAHTGTAGVVSEANSLVGSKTGDFVHATVIPLAKGNYVVDSPAWKRTNVPSGAVTWIDAAAPLTGAVSADNSLVASATAGHIGATITPLANGNYVVSSPNWARRGVVDAGAVTWGAGGEPLVGEVTTRNSLTGTHAHDRVGFDIVPLENGNYLVLSSTWNNGAALRAGAVTWADGTRPFVDTVSTSNSIVGTATDDRIGSVGYALRNGNAVVYSPAWNEVRGAATWIDGTRGLVGTVSAANSLVGSDPAQPIAHVTPLAGGNYVVSLPQWTHEGQTSVGAAAWGDGLHGTTGEMSSAIALVGTHAEQRVGDAVRAVAGGNYVVYSSDSMSLGRGEVPVSGPVDASNSALPPDRKEHAPLAYDYDAARDRLIVSWYDLRIIDVLEPDVVFENGFE